MSDAMRDLGQPLVLVGARMNNCQSGDENSYYGANKCIDGSRSSPCVAAKNENGDNWLSVQTDGTSRIGYIAVFAYRAWEGIRATPFEVWVGNDFGDTESTEAVRCTFTGSESHPSTIWREPISGAPVLVACSASSGNFVTLRQHGKGRSLFISEIVAFAPSPGANDALARPRPSYIRRNAAAGISRRYSEGHPSMSIREAGVLVHLFDNFEDWHGGQPWRMCNTGCTVPVDHFSCSIITRMRPKIYEGDGIVGGMVLAPDTEILCAFDHVIGTGSQINGGCPKVWQPEQLFEVLQAGETQNWINQVIVGDFDLERNLPHAIDAFFISKGDGAKVIDAHEKFLRAYGLCSSDVPLLRYDGASFVDVSPPPPDDIHCPERQLPSCVAGRSEVAGIGTCEDMSSEEDCERSFQWTDAGEAVPCHWHSESNECLTYLRRCSEPLPPPLFPPPYPPKPSPPPTPSPHPTLPLPSPPPPPRAGHKAAPVRHPPSSPAAGPTAGPVPSSAVRDKFTVAAVGIGVLLISCVCIMVIVACKGRLRSWISGGSDDDIDDLRFKGVSRGRRGAARGDQSRSKTSKTLAKGSKKVPPSRSRKTSSRACGNEEEGTSLFADEPPGGFD